MRLRIASDLLLGAALVLAAVPAAASDHADPAISPPKHQEAGLTGLFAFPDGDRMIVILNIRRGLSTPAPYSLEDYEYTIHMDLQSRVSYGKAEDVARYGGTVENPAGIASQVQIKFRLTNDAGLQTGYPRFEGSTTLRDAVNFPLFVGVRDDPFIFPRFNGKNVIAMALSIPFSAFPPGQQDWLLWATTTRARGGKQIDHVGRSNRTQLGRLDFLNTLPPAEHAKVIHDKLDSGQKIQSGIMHLMGHLPSLGAIGGLFEYVFQIRYYDIFPDVMLFTTRRPPGYPNGRRLEDDVAGLTCAQGDCVLQEVAFIEGGWPRATVNDVPLAAEFPFLGAPHPEQPEVDSVDRCALVFWLVVLAIAAILILVWRRRAAANEVPFVRPYRQR